MKKQVLTILLAALFMLTLAACGSSGNSSNAGSQTGGAAASTEQAASGEETTAPASSEDIIINLYEHSDSEAFVNEQVDAFNALDNGITVVPHIIANDAYDDKIKVLITGNGEELDVMWLRGSSIVKQYMDNGALEDLAPYAAASGLDLSPIDATLDSVRRDNAFYGLPMTGSAWMLFYNKDLFDAKGITYPQQLTWDEYADLAKQFTGEEGGTQYWGGLLPDWTMNLGASAAGEYLTADPMPYTRKYAEFLHRIYVDDKSHPGIATITSGSYDYNAVFEQGVAYMMINGDWDLNLLNSDAVNFGVAPLPVFEGVEAESTVGQASYYCISSTSKKKEAAYNLIEYMVTSDAGTTVYAEYSQVPSYGTEAALNKFKETVTVEGVNYRFSAKINNEVGLESYYNDLNDAFKQELKLYLLDEQSLDKTFDNYYKLRAEKAE